MMLLHPCPICGTLVNAGKDLKDPLSVAEWKISGLCQACQDATFIDI
jgi:hypothetical protein